MKQRTKLVSWKTGRKKYPVRGTKQTHKKRLKKNEDHLKQLQDNMKHNNIHIIGISKWRRKGARDRKPV